MDEPVLIDPGRLRQFGDPEGATFCLLTNQAYVDHLKVETEAPYADVRILTCGEGDDIEAIFASEIPTRAHVLVVSPERFFESPPESVLGAERKLLAMACNSTPTELEVVRHFMSVLEATDPIEQDAFADHFFELVEEAEFLRIVNDELHTELIFNHLSEEYIWNQQAGSMDWGTQQIVPSGEISVLPIEIRSFDSSLRLDLNGELVLHGHPILHSGTPSFLREDQARIHESLIAIEVEPLLATVERGIVTSLRPAEGATSRRVAFEMLDAMFAVDSRYRIVWEIGFALNTSLVLYPGNHAMNEVYGGTNGCLHWGFGLTPYTQYHLDVISPGTRVFTDSGVPVLG